MITDADTYFRDGCGRCQRFETPDCSARAWAEGLAHLRRILLSEGLNETAKWGQPCYLHNARNIALLGSFRDDFRMTFFNGSLLKDPNHILTKRGSNTQQADIVVFKTADQVLEMEPVIRAYLNEAKTYADAAIKPIKKTIDVVLPVELIDALETDPDLGDAFNALTSGRQRSYAIAINAAKKPETRVARIAKFRSKIIAGKGATER